MSTKENKTGSIAKFFGFFSGAREELKKVSHPTRQETMQATLVTLVIVVFMAIVLALYDLILNQLMMVIL